MCCLLPIHFQGSPLTLKLASTQMNKAVILDSWSSFVYVNLISQNDKIFSFWHSVLFVEGEDVQT